MTSDLRTLPPAALFAVARRDLARHPRLGDDWSVSSLLTEAERAWNQAVESVVDSALTPPRKVRDFLFESGAQLQQLAVDAWSRGASAAAGALDELSGRVANAIASVGASTDQVLRELMGGTPYDFALLGAGLLVLLGAGLFLTPGGQALAAHAMTTQAGLARDLGPAIAQLLVKVP